MFKKQNARAECKINAQEIREFFYNYNCENGRENIKLKERELEKNTIKLSQEPDQQNTKRTELLLRQTYPQLCPSKRESTATNRWELGSKQNVKCNTIHSLIAALCLMYSKCVLTSFSK
jgi:hypothetical protein